MEYQWFSKHSALSVVSPSLRVTFSRLVQFLKAAPSIVVTEEGISISVTVLGIVISFNGEENEEIEIRILIFANNDFHGCGISEYVTLKKK